MMKYGMYLAAAIVSLTILIAGCQSRNLGLGKNSQKSVGVPENSIDGYAKAHGISREEAAKRMREKLVPPDASHFDSPAVANSSNGANGEIKASYESQPSSTAQNTSPNYPKN
jgi:hypothetical protein